jgi:hypothetical protein
MKQCCIKYGKKFPKKSPLKKGISPSVPIFKCGAVALVRDSGRLLSGQC